MLFVLSTGNKVLTNSLVFQGCWIYIDLKDILHFDSLILLNTFLCNFVLMFYFGWQHLHSYILLFVSTRQVVLICFCIFRSSVKFSVEILSFSFCLVNFECDGYLPADHSSVYSHPKLFLLFFSLIMTLV